MDSPVSQENSEQTIHADAEGRSEVSPQIRINAEKIRLSVAQSTANSIEGLQKLTSELQDLQQFLKSEVERVQAEIESALSGINIILETIAPWNSPGVPLTPQQPNGRDLRRL